MFNYQHKKYDPYTNTYNEGWRDHPNLRYGPPQPQPLVNQIGKNSILLEQLMKKMNQDKKDTDARFNSMETVLKQMSQTQEVNKALQNIIMIPNLIQS